MKVNRIRLSNILGIEELEFNAGQFNEITGPNGVGKTSVLTAIATALKGGSVAELLRSGTSKGEIVLELDDGSEVKRKISGDKATLEVSAGGVKIPKPQDHLSKLADALATNPVDFLLADKKERAKLLLETMPIKLDPERLAAIVGHPVTQPKGMSGLDWLKALRQGEFDERTNINRQLKERESTISQLEAAMPDAPAVEALDLTALQAQLDDLAEETTVEKERCDQHLKRLHGKADEEIAALQAQINNLEQQKRDATSRCDTRKAQLDAELAEKAAPIKAQIAGRDAAVAAQAKREQALETVAGLKKAVETLQRDSDNKTSVLEQIDAYKADLLASLPIEGLEVVDGDVRLGGVLLDQVNTARQVQLAFELAKLRAGELGVICIDRLECLDPVTYDVFKEVALESGLQLFVSRVGGREFNITQAEAA